MKTIENNKRQRFYNYIDQWRASGLKREDFCKEYGISLHSFRYYVTQRNKEGRKADEHSPFVPITVTGPVHKEPFLIAYPNGVRLEVPSSIPLNELKTLIDLF